VFRDESERIIRRARRLDNDDETHSLDSLLIQSKSSAYSQTSHPNYLASLVPIPICSALSQPINQLGANFYFTNYTFDECPYSRRCREWIVQIYSEEHPNNILRAAIEAVGMAGISNVFNAPEVAYKSKEQYCRVLAATKKALSDPIEVTSDKTLAAVILLGLYEAIP
jgi:hypothetical protein